jgi:hypothetical protein
MATLFSRDPTTIGLHVRNALREELAGLATTADFAVVRNEGGRLVERIDATVTPLPPTKTTVGTDKTSFVSVLLDQYETTRQQSTPKSRSSPG